MVWIGLQLAFMALSALIFLLVLWFYEHYGVEAFVWYAAVVLVSTPAVAFLNYRYYRRATRHQR